jgi:hypothetical protein
LNPEVGGGELGVLCFGLAQTSHPSLVFLNLMWLMMRWIQGDTPIAGLDDPKEKAGTVAHLYCTMSQGMDMGFAASPVFPVHWEGRMGQDLEDLRRELGIVPVREPTGVMTKRGQRNWLFAATRFEPSSCVKRGWLRRSISAAAPVARRSGPI